MVAFKSRLGAVWGAVWALLRCVTRVGAAQYSTVQRAAKMTGRWVGGAREERFGGNAGRCSTWERRATARGYLCCCLKCAAKSQFGGDVGRICRTINLMMVIISSIIHRHRHDEHFLQHPHDHHEEGMFIIIIVISRDHICYKQYK